jgi:polyhydroxybutyrate depolymerase
MPGALPHPLVAGSHLMRAAFAAMVFALSFPAAAGGSAPGDYRFDIDSGGRHRNYLLHVPPQAAARPLPLILSLHGGGGNAQQHRQGSGMDAAADRDGYLAAYPEGSGRLAGRLLTWNAGNCCGYAQAQAIDDVGFLAAVIDDIERRTAVDPGRVYVVGHSNGGMMAHRVASALPAQLAAVVSVAGARLPEPGAGRAVPVLHIHSVDDPRAPYPGGLGPPFPFTSSRVLHTSVEATVAAWAKRDGCDMIPVEKESRQAHGGHTAQRLVHEHCRDGAEVALWKLTGAGHGWPGAPPAREALIGPATTVIDANTEIWRFVSRFALPGSAGR